MLHGHDFKPDWVFRGLVEQRPFLGLELEMEVDGDRWDKEELVDFVEDDCNVNEDLDFFFKEDGSLDYGIELVTHPTTLQFFKNWKKLESAIELLQDEGCWSHDTDTCGIHVHIDRDSFHSARHQQRFVYAIDKMMEYSMLYDFTRRTENEVEQWCNPRGLRWVDDVYIWEDDTRYVAVNTCNSKTIEVRIFKGTLKWETILAILEFMHLAWRVSRNIRIDKMETNCGNWIFLKLFSHAIKNKELYSNFINYCKRRFSNRLLGHAEIYKQEDVKKYLQEVV